METSGKAVLPGDVLPLAADAKKSAVVRLGPGLLQTDDAIRATQPGLLLTNPSNNTWWVNGSTKRYVPALGEPVIGIVVSRTAEHYRVDIGSANAALLPVLAFEGATKRNRPNLTVGTPVYARITLANRDMEPEIECVNSSSGKADGFGELTGGLITHCSLQQCQRLLDPDNIVLNAIGAKIPLDVAIGLNGRVWVNNEKHKNVILVVNAITSSEFLSPEQCQALLQSLITKLEL
ncbi:exosome non-catalytic core subunit rrp40 [Dimargaris xerosporica]|nr:exosome non-catalytic core subunit rrp40 [Dimargaris xerosporica]